MIYLFLELLITLILLAVAFVGLVEYWHKSNSQQYRCYGLLFSLFIINFLYTMNTENMSFKDIHNQVREIMEGDSLLHDKVIEVVTLSRKIDLEKVEPTKDIIKTSQLHSISNGIELRIQSEHASVYLSANHTMIFSFYEKGMGGESYEISARQLRDILNINLEKQKL